MTPEQFKKEVLPVKNKLYRFALSFVYDAELAKDIVQEVFMKLWSQREKLIGIQNIEAWCMTITKNQCLDKLRKKKLHIVDLQEAKYQISGHEVSDHSTINDDLMEKIELTLASLPEKQREIFRLRDLLGYSNQEIEKLLKLDDNQVKVNLFRARQKVRQSLTKIMNYGLESTQAAG
jgi:RNA polymerase sigma-70 factor (ECF subfamily)